MAGGAPPLRLKDLLELDCDSCSAAGFRCYPRRLGESAPMRRLLESSPSLRRRPSKLSHLSRSLSRRLSRGGFWRRRDEDDEDAAAAPAPAPACTGCGSSSEELDTASDSSDSSSVRTSRRRSRSESDSDFSSATEDSVHHPSLATPAAAGDEHEVAMKRESKEVSTSGSEADDKEQLSPVAVMDFPFDDDEDAGAACSPSFSLSRLQRGKIRRFGSRDELKPMDLETLLAATSDADDVPAPQVIQHRMEGAATPACASSGHRGAGVHDEDDGIISLLMGKSSAGGVDDVSQRLLLDFFVETKRRRTEAAHARAELTAPAAGVRLRKAERLGDGEAVAAARGWLEGTGPHRGLNDVLSAGAAIVAEMNRGRRWMQVGDEEREVGAVVAAMLADQLVDEVLMCLLV